MVWGKKKIAKVIEPAKVEEKPAAVPEDKLIKLQCTIVEGHLLENGMYMFTIMSTKSIGEIGDEFELG